MKKRMQEVPEKMRHLSMGLNSKSNLFQYLKRHYSKQPSQVQKNTDSGHNIDKDMFLPRTEQVSFNMKKRDFELI